jgi:hypothetical protein
VLDVGNVFHAVFLDNSPDSLKILINSALLIVPALNDPQKLHKILPQSSTAGDLGTKTCSRKLFLRSMNSIVSYLLHNEEPL